MRHLFFVVALLGSCRLAPAAPLATLDMDALLFSSESVIEGPIHTVHVRPYGRSADVRVEKTWAGLGFTGQTVAVGNVGLYVKDLPGQRRDFLSSGDRAIFFLHEPELYSVHMEGVHYWALPSGVRLVRDGQVAGFTQKSNPGGYNQLPGVSRAVFAAGFAASQARVADLKRHLRAPVRREDKAYFEKWSLARRNRLQPRGFGPDGAISQAIEGRLRQIAQLKHRAAPTAKQRRSNGEATAKQRRSNGEATAKQLR